MSVRPTGLWALAVTIALIGAGCGFGLSGPDPQRPRGEPPKCDTGKGAVVVDGVMATLASVVALALVANDEPAAALIPGGIAAAYIGGAVHGSRAVDECRAAQEQWSNEMAARDTLPNPPPGDDVEEDAPPKHKVRKPIIGPSGPPEISAIQPPVPVAPPPPVPTVEQAPPEQAPVQPPPPQDKPTSPPPAKKKATPPPPPSDDEWSDFWREVQ